MRRKKEPAASGSSSGRASFNSRRTVTPGGALLFESFAGEDTGGD